MTGQDLPYALGWHQSKVGRIEAGKNLIRVDDVEALVSVLEAFPDEASADARPGGGERRGAGVLAELVAVGLTRRQRDFIALEASAVGVLHYRPMLVPGYMQTPEAARWIAAIVGASGDGLFGRRAALQRRSGASGSGSGRTPTGGGRPNVAE